MSRGQFPTFSQQPFWLRIFEIHSTSLYYNHTWIPLLKDSLHHWKTPSITSFCPLPSARDSLLAAMSVDCKASDILPDAVGSFSLEFFSLLFSPLIDILHPGIRTTFSANPNMFRSVSVNSVYHIFYPLAFGQIIPIPERQTFSSWLTAHLFPHLTGQHAVRWACNLKENGSACLDHRLKTIRHKTSCHGTKLCCMFWWELPNHSRLVILNHRLIVGDQWLIYASDMFSMVRASQSLEVLSPAILRRLSLESFKVATSLVNTWTVLVKSFTIFSSCPSLDELWDWLA